MAKTISKTPVTAGHNKRKGRMKEFFQKLSRGLMLPIALLPIAGMFLGIGAGTINIMEQSFGMTEAANPG